MQQGQRQRQEEEILEAHRAVLHFAVQAGVKRQIEGRSQCARSSGRRTAESLGQALELSWEDAVEIGEHRITGLSRGGPVGRNGESQET